MTNAGLGALRVACEVFYHPAVIAAVGAEVEFGPNVKGTQWSPADFAAGHRDAHQASTHDKRSVHPSTQLMLQRAAGRALACRHLLSSSVADVAEANAGCIVVIARNNPKYQEAIAS